MSTQQKYKYLVIYSFIILWVKRVQTLPEYDLSYLEGVIYDLISPCSSMDDCVLFKI